MFRSTRLKLTAWYLLIIMVVSILFSVVIFISFNRELERFQHSQELRRERLESEILGAPLIGGTDADIALVNDTRNRLIFSLIFLNICILGGSGVAGFFLAGRTLSPIQEMVDEQSRFIGDASHELKTPLTSLRSEIEVYLRSKKRSINDAEELLKSNLEEAIRLQNLSESLMELTSFEKREIQNNPMGAVSINKILTQAVKKVTPLAKGKNIEILLKIKDKEIGGDEKSLTELFVILLDNAIKYSQKKGKVTVVSKVDDGKAVIQIIDTGIGIDKEDLGHIFDRFYRVDKSRNSDVSGYGLGLSIAREIIKLHNGEITVKSEAGKGSVFTVTL